MFKLPIKVPEKRNLAFSRILGLKIIAINVNIHPISQILQLVSHPDLLFLKLNYDPTYCPTLHRLPQLLPMEGKRLLEVKICDENHRDTATSGDGTPHVGARSQSDSHKE